MNEPAIEVLGVYRLEVTDDLLREQLSMLYPDDLPHRDGVEAEEEVREQLESVVLIEALVRNRDGRFDASDFVQPLDAAPEEDWQAAWAEAYLSPDGQSLAVEHGSPPPATGDLRVAFFMHQWDPTRSLRSSYGELECPAPQEMPEHLRELVPYEPVD